MNISDFKIYEEYQEAQCMIFARRFGEYGVQNQILMERLKEWISEKGYLCDSSVILGIARDNRSITKADRCRYDVCFLGDYDISEIDWLSNGITDEGKYIVLRFPHTSEAVGFVWQEAFGYLVLQGYKLDFQRPVIERYKKQLVDQHLCEMMFPIK